MKLRGCEPAREWECGRGRHHALQNASSCVFSFGGLPADMLPPCNPRLLMAFALGHAPQTVGLQENSVS